VAGTVVEMYRGSFEGDFGMAADALFRDPDDWFERGEGELAVVADRVQVLVDQRD
jgi:hypothetical protein